MPELCFLRVVAPTFSYGSSHFGHEVLPPPQTSASADDRDLTFDSNLLLNFVKGTTERGREREREHWRCTVLHSWGVKATIRKDDSSLQTVLAGLAEPDPCCARSERHENIRPVLRGHWPRRHDVKSFCLAPLAKTWNPSVCCPLDFLK